MNRVVATEKLHKSNQGWSIQGLQGRASSPFGSGNLGCVEKEILIMWKGFLLAKAIRDLQDVRNEKGNYSIC